MVGITEYCRERGIPTHLDGARLYMMAAATGIRPQTYASLFDTVYVSLYKYFGAPFGAMLAGTSACIDALYHERRMFGGGLASASMAAALALQGTQGFEERFANAMSKAQQLFEMLNKLPELQIDRFQHGSNIFPVSVDGKIDVAKLVSGLRERQVCIRLDEGQSDTLRLTVNTTWLRQPNEAIVVAFQHAISEVLSSSPQNCARPISYRG